MTTVKQVQVTFDCADPRALSLFWNEVLGYELPPPPPGFESWDAFSATLPEHLRNSASASEDPTGAGHFSIQLGSPRISLRLTVG